MAAFCLQDAYIGYTTGSSTGAINNMSSYVRSVALAQEAEAQDETAMGDNSRYSLGGLKSWAMSLEMNQDFASTLGPGSTHFFGTLSGSTSVWWRVRPTTSAVAATNPEYRGYAMLVSASPVSGTVGDLAITSLEFVGIGDLTRGTSYTTA